MINTQNIAEISEKVAYIEAALKTAGIELPSVTEDDNGKTLQVVAGKWDKGIVIPELPAVTASDEGKTLQVNSSGVWSSGLNFKAVSESLGGNATIVRNGNMRQLILASVAGAASLVTLPEGDRPGTSFITIGRWKDSNNLYYPCTVSILNDGGVTASYVKSDGTASAITDGVVLASAFYIV